MAYKWGLLTTYKSWDDPPSNRQNNKSKLQGFKVQPFSSFVEASELPSVALTVFFVGSCFRGGVGQQKLVGGFNPFEKY